MPQNLLKSQIYAKGWTICDFRNAIGIKQSAFYRKQSGKSEFTQSEIQKIISTLKLTNAEIMNIFFNDLVS